MKNLKIFSLKNSPIGNLPAWLVILFLAVAVIGFADATFLTAKSYLGGTIPCAILNGCEEVVTSQYSKIFGLPVALLGSVYYLLIAVLTLIYLDSGSYRFLGAAARLTVIGLLASIWFIFLQVFVIHALCLYCLVSAGTSTTLFILGVHLVRKY